MNGRGLWAALVAVALAACGASPNSGDSGVVVPSDSGGMCSNTIPNADPNVVNPRYGTLMGTSFREFGVTDSSGTFVPTPLPDCDGNTHAFYAEQYCNPTHRFTVIGIAAGWCNPCMQESQLITDQLVNMYGSRGVRVIQILVQDPNHLPPNGSFCHTWVSTFNLSVVPNAAGVGNYELIDPMQITNQYFPDGYLPSTLIVDNHGVIRYHEDGLDAQNGTLTSIRAQLDQLLAGP